MPKYFFIAHGTLQGVGFRHFVKTTAEKYSLKGFVRNRLDGSVEIYVNGDERAIEMFAKEINIDDRVMQVFSIEKYSQGQKGFPNDLGDYDEFVVEKTL